MGTGACFKNRTRGKREDRRSPVFFPRQFFARALYRLLALYFSGSSCGPQLEVGWHEAPGLTSVCFVCFLYMFFLPVTSSDTFLRFVVSCSSIRITWLLVLGGCSVFLVTKFGNFSRDTSCDRVWPMKTVLHAEPRRKHRREENLFKFYLRNFQTPSCFYQFCSHGLILSSHQAFHYAELRRDRSEDGLHVASFSLQDSWSLGMLSLVNL